MDWGTPPFRTFPLRAFPPSGLRKGCALAFGTPPPFSKSWIRLCKYMLMSCKRWYKLYLRTYNIGIYILQSQPSNAAVMGSQAYTTGPADSMTTGMPTDAMATRDPAVFASQQYPSVYRETVIHKDDRGKYIDPFKNIASKPYGRRLMYDPSHPDKMYASQWSSELADHAGSYSFPTTTGLDPEIPFKQDLQWQVSGSHSMRLISSARLKNKPLISKLRHNGIERIS